MSLTALYDVPAPAKLNLFLHVVGRRADGYHLLQSVFALIDWSDTLHFELRRDGVLARRDLGAALPADDLCLRAARALQRHSGSALGADISIDKQLPSGAGLGGGSSDAASTLLALNRLWQLNWPRERLVALAATLGADVPFFVGGDNAFVEGIGERLTPLALAAQGYAVLKPAAGIATADIFASAQLKRDTPAVILAGFLASAGQACKLDSGYGRNDLQPVAEAVCPEVQGRGPLAGSPLWQQPHVGVGQRGVCKGGRGGSIDMAGRRSARRVGRPDVPQPGPAPAEGLGRLRNG